LLGSYAGIAAAYSVGRGILGPLLGGWRPTFRVLAVVSLAFLAVWVPVAWWHARKHGTPYDEGSDSAFSLRSFRADVARVFAHRAMRLLVVVGTAYLLLSRPPGMAPRRSSNHAASTRVSPPPSPRCSSSARPPARW